MMKRLCVATIIFLIMSSFPCYAEHGQLPQWVDKSTDGNGNRCCGEIDCVAVESVEILEEGGGFVDVRINGKEGIIDEYALVYVCPKDDPDRRSFICLQTMAKFNEEYRNCLSRHPDGTYDMILAPNCVRCLLLPQCLQNSS